MLRFAPIRFSSSSSPSQLSFNQKKAQFLNIISQLDSLHTVLLRRDGAPYEIKQQAKFLLGDQELTRMIMYEPEVVPTNHLAAFANQIAALSSLKDPPHPQFFKKLGVVFEHHLNVVQTDLTQAEEMFNKGHIRNTSASSSSSSPLASMQRRRQEQMGNRDSSSFSLENNLNMLKANNTNTMHPNDYSSGQDVLFDSQHRREGLMAAAPRSITESNYHHHTQQQEKTTSSSSTMSSSSAAEATHSGKNLEESANSAADSEQYSQQGFNQQHYDYYAAANSEQNYDVGNHHSLEELEEDSSHLSSSSYPRIVASIMECIVTLCGDSRSISTIPLEMSNCLSIAQNLSLHLLGREAKTPVSLVDNMIGGASVENNTNNNKPTRRRGGGVECSPRHIIAFLRCADLSLGGSKSFHFSHRGVSAHQTMLPIKSKHDMERKAQKYPVMRELLRELERRVPLLTRIDAHVCLRQFAVIGLFNETIVDACLDRITMGLAITPHQQSVDVILHLGVLGHRHIACREILDNINTKSIGPTGMRKLLRGMAMLQIPVVNRDQIKEIHNHVWMWALRPKSKHVTTIAWHIDVAHALSVLGIVHYQFLIRTCRLVRNGMREAGLQLSHLQTSQLLWSIGKVDRVKVPSDLDRDWVKSVNRVKNALIKSAKEQAAKMVSVEEGDLLQEHHSAEYYQHLHNSPSSVSIHGDPSNSLPILLQGLEACGIHAGDVMKKTK